MRRLLGLVATGIVGLMLVVSCGKKEEYKEYTLQGNFNEALTDMPVLLISMSTGDTLAYDTIRNGHFTINGKLVRPDLAQLRIGGSKSGNIVLEPGTVYYSIDSIGGTPLNEVMHRFNKKGNEVFEALTQLQKDSILPDTVKYRELKELSENYQNYKDSIKLANIDNPVGASFFIDDAYEMSTEDLQQTMEDHPSLKAYSKLNLILSQKKLAQETAPGKPYKDFEVSFNGTTTKLSDLIQPDHFTLVDFWASWCGPCRREIPVIKQIKEEWGPKGLDVIGVAVWDEPADTEKAVQELGIDWPVIINAQTIPTDIYGILSIPSIFLIGPDGIILARDVTGQDLQEAVSNAMTK